MAGVLEPAQHDEPDQVADVQAVGRRVAAVVDRHRAVGHRGPEGLTVGRVVDEVSGLEIGDQVGTSHTARSRVLSRAVPDPVVDSSLDSKWRGSSRVGHHVTPPGPAVRRAVGRDLRRP